MDQLIPFHKPNRKSEEWEDDGLARSSNQTDYNILKACSVIDITCVLECIGWDCDEFWLVMDLNRLNPTQYMWIITKTNKASGLFGNKVFLEFWSKTIVLENTIVFFVKVVWLHCKRLYFEYLSIFRIFETSLQPKGFVYN
jgi:hypothetical protein